MVLRVVVVGGGVGGLAVAAAFARSHHRVTVYERSPTSGGVGYAFRLTTNSERCLQHLDIDSVAGGACAAVGGFILRADGEVVAETKENVDADKRGGTSVFAYRPQVHHQLHAAATQAGAKVEYGVEVASVDPAKSCVHLTDGQTVEADLIIGADGVNSIVRSAVVDAAKHSPSASSHHNAFRFMISMEDAARDPALSQFYKDKKTTHVSWSNSSKRIIAYPVDYGKQINLVCTHPEHLSDPEKDKSAGSRIDYNQNLSKETALEIYSEFEPRARRFIEMADPNGFRAWKLMDADDIPRWSLDQTVLIGDCCHPLLPFSFSGASMALEDATVLSGLLPEDATPGEVRDRLNLFERIRRPRVDRVRVTARKIARDELGAKDIKEYFEFLNGYDAVAEAFKYMAE